MRHPRQSPRALRIVVHGFNDRAFSMLSQLLAGPDWKDCSLVGQGEADMGLVDLDTASPERTWQEYRRRNPDLPAIVLSLREQHRDGARHLKKPVDPATLRAAIDALRAEIERPSRPKQASVAAAASSVPTPPAGGLPAAGTGGIPRPPAQSGSPAFVPFVKRAADNVPHASTREATVALDPDVEERNCGTAADVNLSDRREWAHVTYDPERHFQAVLEAAIAITRETGTAHEIRGLPGPFLVLPGRQLRVATPLKDAVLRSLCVMTLQPGSVHVAPAAVAPPAATIRPIGATALLWQVALWTARGRLRQGIEPVTRLQLQHWPDFTRVVETPHAMRIAALLVAAPHTAEQLCAALGIPQRHVFSFIAAAATTTQLAIAGAGAARAEEAPAPARAPLPQAARAAPPRSLLARILGRLLPGAA